MAEQEPSTRITLRHVYVEQQEMRILLRQVADQLPVLKQSLADHEIETASIVRDHENRIRQLETKLWKLFGAIAVIAGLAPFIARALP